MSKIKTCTVRNEEIRLHLDSDEPGGEIRNYELWRAETYAEKETDTLDWIDGLALDGDCTVQAPRDRDPGDSDAVVFFDVGANIGLYSLYAASRWGAAIDVWGFEPEALNFAKLNRNIFENRLSNTRGFCIAIGGESRIDQFFVNRFTPGAALHALGKPMTQGDEPFEAAHRQGALALSLDDLVYRYGAPVPAHIKVDVDGIETEIVAGADRLLRDPGLESVLIEVYMFGDTADRIVRAFEHAGFELSNTVDFTEGIVQNLIFKRSSH